MGKRLRSARVNLGMNQEDAASELGVLRPTISQIEAGKRGVSGLELARLAKLYHRPLSSFFEEEATGELEDSFTVLLRAAQLEPSDQEVVREFEGLCRNYSVLEDVLNVEREVALPEYGEDYGPRDKWNAIRQGEQVAAEERRRLGIGDDPIRDVPELLDSQGIRLFIRPLHEGGISGLFLYDRKIGPCILINGAEHPNRLPFNVAHEYAHVLLDRNLGARVSSASRMLSIHDQQEELVEVRANSFAAAFLMPTAGIERFLSDRGKARGNRHSIGVVDVLLLQRGFGVNYQAALYRLQNLGWLDKDEREALEEHRPDVLARQLGLEEDAAPKQERLSGIGGYPVGYIYLVLKAYQEGRISLGRLSELLDLTLEDARELVWDLDSPREGDEGQRL